MKYKEKEPHGNAVCNAVVENFLEKCTSSASHRLNHNKEKQHKEAQVSAP